MQYMTFAEMHEKWSVILTDRFGPAILTMLEIKGQALHRVRVHLKVSPGLLSDLNALLTRKLPLFSSRLNDMSGEIKRRGYQKENYHKTWLPGTPLSPLANIVPKKAIEKPHHKRHRTKKPTEFHSPSPTIHKTLQSKMSFSKTSKFFAMILKLNVHFLYHHKTSCAPF